MITLPRNHPMSTLTPEQREMAQAKQVKPANASSNGPYRVALRLIARAQERGFEVNNLAAAIALGGISEQEWSEALSELHGGES